MALVEVRLKRTSDACPFLNNELSFSLNEGEVFWLRGASGAGKSFLSMHIAGLTTLPGADVDVRWREGVPSEQRVGFLFQKGVLIDSLNIAENLALASKAAGLPSSIESIGEALRAVGLNLGADGPKMPGELSGGMLRRAALAQILAQRKRLVILDEPFVGLDPPVAREIVAQLRALGSEHGVAMVLISHMEEHAKALATAGHLELDRARPEDKDATGRAASLAALPLRVRTGRRLLDYLFISLPLIVTAFAATGAALSMLLADMLQVRASAASSSPPCNRHVTAM